MLILSSLETLCSGVFKFCVGRIQFSKCASEQCTVPMFSYQYYLTEEFSVADVMLSQNSPHMSRFCLCMMIQLQSATQADKDVPNSMNPFSLCTHYYQCFGMNACEHHQIIMSILKLSISSMLAITENVFPGITIGNCLDE